MMLLQSNGTVLVLCLFIGKQEDIHWRLTKEIQKHRRMWSKYSKISVELLSMASYGATIPSGSLDMNDAVYRVLWSNGLDYRDNLVVIFRGNLKIHSVIEGEHEALLPSFVHYEASLMDEDHLWYDQSCATEIVGTSTSKPC